MPFPNFNQFYKNILKGAVSEISSDLKCKESNIFKYELDINVYDFKTDYFQLWFL